MELKPVFSVSELCGYMELLCQNDQNLASLTVEGEISGAKSYPSGILYFSLKDAESQLRCVMFKQNFLRLSFRPRDGMRVRLYGFAQFYPRDGSFSIVALRLEKQGEGDLMASFLKYKKELESLGWFDPQKRKPLPFLPKCVGVVTSPAGAAIHDIRNVIARRFPAMPLRLYPAQVQGEGAEAEIARAIRTADSERRCDVLIVGRGGGSIEELWAFNLPKVAAAIHECGIPVISAVGHETDFTIADFVADRRAPTPSAAAELAVPEYDKLKAALNAQKDRLVRALLGGLERKRARLAACSGRAAFVRTEHRLMQTRSRLEGDRAALLGAAERTLAERDSRLRELGAKLEAYSPKRSLERGFVLVKNEGGALVARGGELRPGQGLQLEFIDMLVKALVTSTDGEQEEV